MTLGMSFIIIYKGPCYARHLAQTLHRDEDYVLQIDSHMRFRPNWDVYLIHQLKKCAKSTTNDSITRPRAVLTAYPPNYDPPHGPGANAETRATLLVPWKFGEDGMLRQKGRLLRSDFTLHNDNIPCLLFAGGFNFSHSSVLEDCTYEKLHGLFFGEEISMALRLYTHGYYMFSPPETVCYHQWRRNPLRKRDPMKADKNHCLESQRKASLNAVRMQLQGLGRGLGNHRSARQFAIDLGVDFDTCTLIHGCENGSLSEDAFASSVCASPVKDNQLEQNDINQVLKLVASFI